MEGERLMTARETAALLGVPLGRLYDLVRAGLVPGVRLGRSYRFSRRALAQFIDAGGRAWGGGWRKATSSDGAAPADR